MKKTFNIDKSSWTSIDEESIKFILEEGKDYLNYTLEESKRITNRSFSLLILISSGLFALSGVVLSQLTNNIYVVFILPNIGMCAVLIYELTQFIKLIFPRKTWQKGRQPREISSKIQLQNQNLNNKQIYLTYLINEVENTQTKIDCNLSINNDRGKDLEKHLNIILISIPLFIIVSFLTYVLFR